VDRINQWLTLIANLGVLAGIVFLAYEIQVNTNAVLSATYESYDAGAGAHAAFQAEHAADLAAIYKHTGLDQLNDEQQLIFFAFALMTFANVESLYLHLRAGSLDADVVEAKLGDFARLLGRNELLNQAWYGGRLGMLPEFKDYVESRIEAAQTDGT
jgi:hypothetical protein